MRILIALLLIALLNACSTYSGPEESVEISTETTIEQLAGLYLNAGEPSGYLSQVIWGDGAINTGPDKKLLNHSEIEYIQVISTHSSITVKAIAGNCSAYEKEYMLGRDFEMNNGEIILSSEFSAITRGVGDPLVGPSAEKTLLSLDTQGHGIYRNEFVAAGLVYLLVPVAIAGKSEIRFKKTTANESFEKCAAVSK